MNCAIPQLRLELRVHQSAQAAVVRVSHAQIKLGVHRAAGKGRYVGAVSVVVQVNKVGLRCRGGISRCCALIVSRAPGSGWACRGRWLRVRRLTKSGSGKQKTDENGQNYIQRTGGELAHRLTPGSDFFE